MKAQTTIVVALLAVLGILLASTSATTYSWWSDSEEADIEITSGYLDAVTSEVYFWSGDVDTQKTTADFANLKEFDDEATIFINSENYKVKIQYTVEFKANIDAQYKISIDAHMNGADSVSVTETYVKDNVSVEGPSIWTPLDTTDGVEASVKYIVTALVEFRGVPQGITSDEAKGALSIKNEITQYGAVNETYVPAGDSDRDVEVLGTDGNLWNVGVEFTDVSNVSVLDVDIDSVAGSENSFIINLSLDSEVTFDSAKVSITIPGVINDGMVVYLGDGSQPTAVTITNDGVNTTVTFITTHFSEFMVFDMNINSVDEFELFADMVNEYGIDFSGKTIALANDINLAGINWTPIGNADAPFMGTFDGNGFKISNLKIDAPSTSYVGLFGMTEGASLNNVDLFNVDVKGQKRVGGLVGCGYTGSITGCDISGSISVVGNYQVGGINGHGYATIKDCSVISTVTTNGTITGEYLQTDLEGDAVGGIVGYRAEGNKVLTGCEVKNMDISGTRKVGGIAGQIGASSSLEITNVSGCSFVGKVSTNASDVYKSDNSGKIFVGGIIGEVTASGYMNIKDCNANVEFGESDAIYGKIVAGARNASVIVTIEGVAAVFNADQLVNALENKYDVVLMNDIKIEPAKMSNAYGKTGINVKYGQTIDGAGHTLDIKGAGGTWDSGINTTGGTIKNITVTGSFRGIFINHNSDHSETVVLEKVIIKGTTYTISCDQGMNQDLVATNCEFYGWTSYAATIGEVEFIDCVFGEGSGYKYCRPYAPTEFIRCTFEEGFTVDGTKADSKFTNCVFEEGAIVTGTPIVDGKIGVFTADYLQKALDNGCTDVMICQDLVGDVIIPKDNVTIIGNDHVFCGSISINGKSGVTLKNIVFDAAGAKMSYDGSGKAKQYANIMAAESKGLIGARNLTIDGCTFTGTFTNGGAAISFVDQNRKSGASGNITIKNCTFNTIGAYYDIYGHYCGNGTNGYGDFVIEKNTFKTEFTQGGPIYLGRYASSTPVVVIGNTFESTGSLEDSMYVQDHSDYGVSIDASNNTFAS